MDTLAGEPLDGGSCNGIDDSSTMVVTGKEYPNGAANGSDANVIDDSYEIVVFKTRTKRGAERKKHSVINDCTTEKCFCDDELRMADVKKFCEDLQNVITSRSALCPYTMDTLLSSEVFGISFEWIELDEGDSEDDEYTVEENEETNSAKDGGKASDAADQRSLINDNESQRFDETMDATPTQKETTAASTPPNGSDKIGHDLSDVSSTTSGDLRNSSRNQVKSSQSDSSKKVRASSSASGAISNIPASGKISQNDSSILGALILRKPVEENSQNEQSSEPESIPQTLETNKDATAIPTTDDIDQHTVSTGASIESITSASAAKSSLTSEAETETNAANTNGVLDGRNEESSDRNADTEDKALSTKDFMPTLTDKEVADAVFAVPNIPTILRTSSDLSITVVTPTPEDPSRSPHENENTSSVPVSVRESEPAKTDESTNNNNSDLSENFAVPSIEPVILPVSTKRPVSPVSSESQPTQPPNKKISISGTNESPSSDNITDIKANTDESVIEKAFFDDTGDCARVRRILGRRPSSIASSDKESERQSDLGEEMEEGEIKEPEASNMEISEPEGANETEKHDEQNSTSEGCRKNNDKRVDRQPAVFPLPQGEGIRTRSKSNRPAPASVKRDRTAKQNAQAKISSKISEAKSSPVKCGEATLSGPAKRLRSSDSSNQSNKNRKVQVENVTQAEEQNSDVRSGSSRSSTPSLDDTYQHQGVRTRRNSPATVQHVTNTDKSLTVDNDQTTTTTRSRKVTVTAPPVMPPLPVITVDTAGTDSDSDSADSGESECSYMSDILYKDRLDRRKKRNEKRMNRLVQSRNSCVTSQARMEKRLNERRELIELTGRSLSTRKNIDEITTKGAELVKNLRMAKERDLESMQKESTPEVPELQIQEDQQKETESVRNQRIEKETVTDDEIQYIDEVPLKSCSTNPSTSTTGDSRPASGRAQNTRQNSIDSSEKGVPEGGIRISFPKDKTSRNLQRSCSSTDVSPDVDNSTPGTGVKAPLTKSMSFPTSSTETGNDLDLEDRPKWQGGISSPRKAQQIPVGLVSANTPSPKVPAPDKSSSVSPATISVDQLQSDNQSPFKTPILERRRSTSSPSRDKAVSAPATPSPSNKAGEPSPSLRTSLRARMESERAYDPKMQAIKLGKPVQKLAKEINLQIPSMPTPTKMVKKTGDPPPKGRETSSLFSNKDKAGPRRTEMSGQKSPAQKDTDDDIEIMTFIQKPSTSNTQKQQLESQNAQKSQQTDKQKDKPEIEIISTRRNSKEITPPQPQPPKIPTPQKPPNPGQKTGTPKSLSFIDGEIRVTPKPSNPTESGSSPGASRNSRGSPSSSGGSASNRASRGDNGRPGSGEAAEAGRNPATVDFTEDPTVDFENPPDDGDSPRSRNARRRNRSAGGFRGGHHRGGQHQPHYGNQQGGYGPPNPGYYVGPRGPGGPRPPFRGGPPRANSINTLTSQGRYQQQRMHEAMMMGDQPRFPLLPPPEQFPPSLMDVQFNPQFVPSFSIRPNGEGNQFPPNGPPYYFRGNHVTEPSHQIPPNYEQCFDPAPPFQQSFPPPFFY